MRIDEEEFLVQSIRSGAIRHHDILIVPATIDQYTAACRIYNNAFQEALDQGLMTEQTLEQWMLESNLLPSNFLIRRDQLIADIDTNKHQLYTNRTSKQLIKSHRQALTNLRSTLKSLLEPRNSFIPNTCEFVAQTAKLIFLLKRTTYKRKKLYKSGNYTHILNIWQSSILSETAIRSIARSNTWKSIWNTKEYGFPLFKYRKNREMTINQRNLVTWSQLYDNIQESLDCPDEEVIADDDMLDGWFIEQKKKRDKEKLESQKEALIGKNSKMQNASHVFLPPQKDSVDFNTLNANADMSKELHKLIPTSE